MRLDSLSGTRSKDQQQLPQFLAASPAQRTEIVGEPRGGRGGVGRTAGGRGLRPTASGRWGGGQRRKGKRGWAWGRGAGPGRSGRRDRLAPPAGTQNHSGQSVFSVVPVEGVMDPGVAQDFTVTFSPDHESLYFSDRLQVVLFEKVRPRPAPSPAPLGRP